MIRPTGQLQTAYSDPEVNRYLRASTSVHEPYTRHFSQNEEFFLRVPRVVEVPAFPVHHDLTEQTPDPRLSEATRSVVEQLHAMNSDILGGLTHLFDPSNNQRPAFFRLYRIKETAYLYLLRLDLGYRPTRATRVERTSNTETATYRTRDVFVEADLFPLTNVVTKDDRLERVDLEQTISDTWIGETGRGYMRAGMWLDRDLTKFFSRMLLPDGVQTYPYYPFTCKYRTVAHTVIELHEEQRRRSVQLLHRARTLLIPHMREIEESLRGVKKNGFSEHMPTFVRLKQLVGDEWNKPWAGFSIRRYLNDEDEREFEVEHGVF